MTYGETLRVGGTMFNQQLVLIERKEKMETGILEKVQRLSENHKSEGGDIMMSRLGLKRVRNVWYPNVRDG